MLDKEYHLKNKKMYLYNYNFDKTVKKDFTEDDLYDKTDSAHRLDVNALFREDELSAMTEEQIKFVNGIPEKGEKEPDDEETVFSRFQARLQGEEVKDCGK